MSIERHNFYTCGHVQSQGWIIVAIIVLFLMFNSRTLLVSSQQLEYSKQILTQYKMGQVKEMNDDLWKAKKIVDSTLHPGTLTQLEMSLVFFY